MLVSGLLALTQGFVKEILSLVGWIVSFVSVILLMPEAGNYLKPFFPEAEIIFKSQGSDPRNYRVNFDKVKNTLGFKAEYNIEDGIKEIIQELNQGHFKIKNYYPDNLGNYVLRKE